MRTFGATARVFLNITGTFDDWTYRVLEEAAKRDNIPINEAFSQMIGRYPEAIEQLCLRIICREADRLEIPLTLEDLKATQKVEDEYDEVEVVSSDDMYVMHVIRDREDSGDPIRLGELLSNPTEEG